jgi:uncharacterized SAM-binding protein YcdF (DUF218 family)
MFAWIAAELLIVNVPLEKADALVVLSGSETLIERATLAAQLFREGRAPKILLTNDNRRGGWVSAQQRNPFFYEGAILELRQHGVPETAIEVLQPPVESTRDEADLVRAYSRQHQLQSVLVVTSAYHSRRAFRTFEQAFAGSGVQVGMRAVEPGSQTPRPAVWWLRTRGWNMVAGEYFKLVYYALR